MLIYQYNHILSKIPTSQASGKGKRQIKTRFFNSYIFGFALGSASMNKIHAGLSFHARASVAHGLVEVRHISGGCLSRVTKERREFRRIAVGRRAFLGTLLSRTTKYLACRGETRPQKSN
jgi:hypothetical protein